MMKNSSCNFDAVTAGGFNELSLSSTWLLLGGWSLEDIGFLHLMDDLETM